MAHVSLPFVMTVRIFHSLLGINEVFQKPQTLRVDILCAVYVPFDFSGQKMVSKHASQFTIYLLKYRCGNKLTKPCSLPTRTGSSSYSHVPLQTLSGLALLLCVR